MKLVALIIAGFVATFLISVALRVGILIYNAIVGRGSPNQVAQPPISYAIVIAFLSLIASTITTGVYIVGVQYAFDAAGALAPTSQPVIVLIVLLSALLLNFLVTAVVTSFVLATPLMRALSVSFYQWILMAIVAATIGFVTSGLWVGAELFKLNP